MKNKMDAQKKLRMVWDKCDDLVIRSNLIKTYLEAILKDLGLNSDKYILLIVDFENKKEMTNSRVDYTTIKINYLNMSGDLDLLLEKIDEMINEIKVNAFKSEYYIDNVNKKIKR